MVWVGATGTGGGTTSSRGIRISGAYVEAVVDPVSVGPVGKPDPYSAAGPTAAGASHPYPIQLLTRFFFDPPGAETKAVGSADSTFLPVSMMRRDAPRWRRNNSTHTSSLPLCSSSEMSSISVTMYFEGGSKKLMSSRWVFIRSK